ncbi:MAG TPA: glycosyltransferase family 1 protein [Candidatus Acidoferrales bacterium]|nr:glycosyltransferase family 1 protein [Candidatus Acidoferrales bacterium]
MRVAIDAQLAVGTATGIGEYVRGLIDALRAEGIDVEELAELKLDPWRFDRRVYWDQIMLPQRARAANVDLLHCASGTVPLSLRMPFVVTVHDVAWLRVQSHARPYARYYFGRFSMERYRRASAIAVDSAFSRDELLGVLPELDPAKVRVVYPGVAQDYCALERRDGDRRTILAIGTVERRKNLELLIEALPFLPDARLIVVGPYTDYQEECEGLAHALHVGHRVEFRGYVPRSELLELCAHAAVIAVPSLYEGFGYAAAQALCAGVPAIVTDRASLPEIVGDAARVVPATNQQAWIAALAAALRGDDDARALAGRAAAIERFAWRKSARDMIATYELALAC